MTITGPVADDAADAVDADIEEPQPRTAPDDGVADGDRAGGRERPEVTFGYTPGFDGLRAAGLLTILAYHHGVGGAKGGIFTLSMFFTLSGFLIATLTLVEWSQHGRVSLARFWERRARRLLPAAFVTVAAVVVLQKWWAIGAGPQFKADLVAALGYVANWRFAFSDGDYAAIFAAERPVQHFWSLAVEEQFYFLFPLLFVGLMRLTRGAWGKVGLAFAGLAALSFVAAGVTAARSGNSELAYYGTHTRAGELLAGVALAFLVVARPVRRFLAGPRGARAVRWGALVGAAGYAWLWTSVGLSSPWVFRGGTLLNATCTSLVILACTAAKPGLVARGLAIWPLRNLGKVSYAVYLFHWPLFLFLDAERTGLGYWPLFAARVGATVALAVVSYHLVESPFRFHLRMPRPQLVAVLAVPAVAVLGLIQVVDVHRTGVIDLSRSAESDPFEESVVSPFMVEITSPPTKILLVGDSVSWTMWWGLGTWNGNHPDRLLSVDAITAMGCPIGTPGVTRFLGEVIEEQSPGCRRFRERIAEVLATRDYDAVILSQGGADLADRRIDGEWRALGDEEFDDWFRADLAAYADIFDEADVPVLWATLPHVRAHDRDDPTRTWRDHPDNDPARVDRLNELFEEVVFTRPGFHRLDVASWVRGAPGGEFDETIRGDGVHYSEDGSNALAEWMVPQVLEVVAADRADGAGGPGIVAAPVAATGAGPDGSTPVAP
ncbi:MAG TPA: acyltransferase family protein [Acidimicrobiales bacterium]